jgi:DNA excision repair protein ERCC-8
VDSLLTPRSSSTHTFGLTGLSFLPFDSAAFLSSSYDHCVKLYATEALAVAASFDLGSIVYGHAISSIAPHMLVACATQHPSVRLVDLRSGSSAQALAGHDGAVLAVAWSPADENVLVSGGTDGSATLWDVRKGAGELARLDREDSVGRPSGQAKAHAGSVNGVAWTDDGAYIVTAGHDDKIRVWEAASRANTLASFGPALRNSALAAMPLLLPPSALTAPKKDVLICPGREHLLLFELHEGRLLKRMRIPRAHGRSRTSSSSTSSSRTTALCWRDPVDGFLSAHDDGQILAWKPRMHDDDHTPDPRNEPAQSGRKRALEGVFRDLTTKRITFG